MSATAQIPGDDAASDGVPADASGPGRSTPWIGWRRRMLAAAALLGCLALLAGARWASGTLHLDAQFSVDAQGALVLQASPEPLLQGLQGRTVVALGDAAGQPRPVNELLLHRSPRWQVDDTNRRRQIEQQELLASRLATGAVELWFEPTARVVVPARPRGWAGLGLLAWPLAALALLLVLNAVVVGLARARLSSLLFGVMSLCQAVNLLFIALDTTRGPGLPAGAASLDLGLRLGLDAVTGAAIVHAFALHPVRLPQARALAWVVWPGVALALVVLTAAEPDRTWWWAQGLCLGLGLLALAVLHRSPRFECDPTALVMRRFNLIALAVLMTVSVTVVVSSTLPGLAHGLAAGASVTWYLFLSSLLLLTPFLARSRQLLREFALLAGISTVAAAVDLLFVAVFSLSAFTSLALAVFGALAAYAGARQLILTRVLGHNLLTTERTFDHLYRAAREVQARPEQHAQVLARLLRDLFEPLSVRRVTPVPPQARVVGGGSALVVPARTGADMAGPALALQLQFAQRGQRLFTPEDARLADRVVEQLRRAAAYDRAVERGRHEERQRLAQDLHDDIGARLLTLMYQAPNPAMEDYIRHTLQDLKTLTRGLAAGEHRLSHAAAEWKADLSQRLGAAQAQLGWAVSHDQDPMLSMVQWSALTRILRELVSNALYHGHATFIDVVLQLDGPGLRLTVSDNGQGRAPEAWAHGLGLGGVRKRVKLLSGTVIWRENEPSGIVCDVRVDQFAPPACEPGLSTDRLGTR